MNDLKKSLTKRRSVVPRIPVTVRLPEELVTQIDDVIDNCIVPTSRNNWLIEAALEKLERCVKEAHGQK